MKYSIIYHIGRLTLLWMMCAVIAIQIIANIRYGLIGGSLAFASYYWLIDFAIIVFTFILILKYTHPFSVICRIPYIGFMVYFTARYLLDSFLILSTLTFVLGITYYCVLGFNLIISIAQIIAISRKHQFLKIRHLKPTNFLKAITILTLIWFPLLIWSYNGCSISAVVVDSGNNNNMKISFYEYPFGNENASYYSTPQGAVELGYYQRMNSTFYIPFNTNDLIEPNSKGNITAIFRIMNQYNISFALDAHVDNAYEKSSDYPTIWYPKELNNSIDFIMNYVTTENFTNFRGIEFDVEGSQYNVQSNGQPMSINESQWAFAVNSIQNKLNEVKQEYPTVGSFLIGIDGILFDNIDGLHYLDIAQSTFTYPPNWDWKGFQTYMVGNPSGDYPYLVECQLGFNQFGSHFIPWVGWFNDYTELTNNPALYTQTLNQVKICKSLGAKEVVLAPSRCFLASDNVSNYPLMIQRLKDLENIQNSTFPMFFIPIHNDYRIYQDLPTYLQKLSPFTFQIEQNIVMDTMYDIQNTWVLYLEIGIFASVLGGYLVYWKFSEKQQRHNDTK
jgi:hypothetical protein